MKFEKISVGRSIVDFLTEAEVFNVTTNVVLTEAEKFGGYIAGGFAFEFLKLLNIKSIILVTKGNFLVC